MWHRLYRNIYARSSALLNNEIKLGKMVCCLLDNKIALATPCGAVLVASVSFVSRLVFYTHNFTEKNSKSHNVQKFGRNFLLPPDRNFFLLFCFWYKNMKS